MDRLNPSSIIPPQNLVQRILSLPRTGRRQLVALAGAPASGKSALAAALPPALQREGRAAQSVPMDGFHLDNRLLDERGLRARKGAPETFDVYGFIALMHRLKDEDEVYYPIFERQQDQAIAGAGMVTASCDLVIVEGNYLLLDETPWRKLADIWDLSIWIETPERIVLERCIQRWLDHGHTAEAARTRAEHNDLANAKRIARALMPADLTLCEPSGL